MSDVLTPDQRSFNMSSIRSKGNRSTEQRLVAIMKAAGITGWRRNSSLPGKPDFVFPKERVAVFVDGCFWHRCPDCFRQPTSNADYWERKIARNVQRDRQVTAELRARGWRVVRIWEHSLKQPEHIPTRMRRALSGRTEARRFDPSSPAPAASPALPSSSGAAVHRW